MTNTHTFVFWNLENLFDIETYPERTEKLQRAIGRDLQGWDQDRLNRKLSQLATVIRQMNFGHGPDILGVCEIENQHVLELLVENLAALGRDYKIVHYNTGDKRGIDVAFIYDGNLFRVPEGPGVESIFSHFIMKRTATRDILQVNFQTVAHNRTLVVMCNHWPSRSGGEAESAAYRAMAGETLSYFHERILEVLGKDTPVMAMGDFNDEPYNESLTDYADAVRSASMVMGGHKPYFLNLMWSLMGKGVFSHYYDGPNLLDQFLVNKNFIKPDSPFKLVSVEVIRFPAMTNPGNQTPIRFGGMGKTVNPDGFSDHYPVQLVLEEKD